jgi:hypothetical protein
VVLISNESEVLIKEKEKEKKRRETMEEKNM